MKRSEHAPDGGNEPEAPEPQRFRSVMVTIDGVTFRHDWLGRTGELHVFAANWLDDLIHTAVVNANPATRIEVAVQ